MKEDEAVHLREIITRASMRLAELSKGVEVSSAVARLRQSGDDALADGVLAALTTFFETIDILAEANPPSTEGKPDG